MPLSSASLNAKVLRLSFSQGSRGSGLPEGRVAQPASQRVASANISLSMGAKSTGKPAWLTRGATRGIVFWMSLGMLLAFLFLSLLFFFGFLAPAPIAEQGLAHLIEAGLETAALDAGDVGNRKRH